MSSLRPWAEALDARYRAPVPALRLAVVRIVVATFATITCAVLLPALAATSRLPASAFRPTLPWRWLAAPLPSPLVVAMAGAGVGAGLAAAVGWKYRVSGPLMALLTLLATSYRSSWGMIFHSENLLVLHALLIAWAPSARALARDGRSADAAADVPGWWLRLMCVTTAASYLLAGLAKLRFAGVGWVSGEFLRDQIAFDNLRKAALGATYSPLAALALRHASFFAPLAAFSLLVELGAPLALLHRRAWGVWALAAVAFHVGILALMAIAFPYPLTGAAFAPGFPLERAVAWVRRRQARARS